MNIISDYVSSNGLNHSIDKKFILITPELKDLLITDNSDYSKIEEDENGEKRYYTSYFKLLELLVKKEHLIKI